MSEEIFSGIGRTYQSVVLTNLAADRVIKNNLKELIT